MPTSRSRGHSPPAATPAPRRTFTDVAETLETLAQIAADLFSPDAVAFFVWNHAGEQLRPGWQQGMSRRGAADFARTVIRRGDAPAWDRLLTRSSGVLAMPASPAALWRGWHTAYAAPLRHSERFYGLLCLFYRRPTPAKEIPNRASLRSACAGAALAISLAQLAEHERTIATQALTLSENLHELTAPLELRAVLARLTKRAVDNEGFRACAVVLRDEASGNLRVAALAGASADFVALVTGRDYPNLMPPQFPSRGYLFLRPELFAHILPFDPAAENVGRMLVMPVRHGAEPAGMLLLIAPREMGLFSAQQLQWAHGLAEQVAVAIETGRLYQRARVLTEVAAAPHYPFDRATYLDEVTRRVRTALGTAVCSVWLGLPNMAAMQLAARAPQLPLSPLPVIPVAGFAPWTPAKLTAQLEIRSRSRLATVIGGRTTVLATIQTPARMFGVLAVTAPVSALPVGDGLTHLLAAIADVTALRLEQQELLDLAAQRERELARHREREQLARDLHDTVMQTLTGVSLQLTALQQRGTPPSTGELAALEHAVRDQFRHMQAFLGRLRTAEPLAIDLRAEIHRLVDDAAQRGPLRPDLKVRGMEGVAAPVAGEITLILREALANIERHAHATHASVYVAARNGYVDIRVSDTGRGFPSTTVSGHTVREPHLPWSIRDRVAALGGQLRIESRRGHGTRVIIRIPHRHSLQRVLSTS